MTIVTPIIPMSASGYFAQPDLLEARTKARSVDINNLSNAIKAAFEILPATGQVWSGVHDYSNGTLRAKTPATGAVGNQVATVDFVNNAAFVSAQLPGQGDSAGKVLSTNGIDPSWVALKTVEGKSIAGEGNIDTGISAAATNTGAANIVLTASSPGYQSVAMTALGKHVALPNAQLLVAGGPRFIIKNDGGFPIGIRDAAGALLMAVAAGGIAYVTLLSNATAAGSWSIIGNGLEPGLITVDAQPTDTLSTDDAISGVFVALDDNTSIHFTKPSNNIGFRAFVMDNANKVMGTPVAVTVASSANKPCAAFRINATQAILFYRTSSSAQQGAVILTVSGTSISVGAEALLSYSTYTSGWDAENMLDVPKIAQLTPTLYVALMTSSSPQASTDAFAISVSGTTITYGAAANLLLIGTQNGLANVIALTATTALALYGADTARVLSIAGTVVTLGDVVTVIGGGTVPACKLSGTKVLIAAQSSNVKVQLLTIAGAVVTAAAAVTVEALGTPSILATNNVATRQNPHLLTLSDTKALFWYFGTDGVSRLSVITEAAGVASAGPLLFGSISKAANTSNGGGTILPMGQSDFLALMQASAPTANDLYKKWLVAHKIEATTVTVNAIEELPALASGPISEHFIGARLPSGDCLIIGTLTGAEPNTGIPVFRTNGVNINNRGVIRGPQMAGHSRLVATVSPNRIVLIGRGPGGPATPVVAPLRILNLEIAK